MPFVVGSFLARWMAVRLSYANAALFLHRDVPDLEINDTEGTLLSSDDAAVEYARRVIDGLREDQKPENSGPTIVVKNEAGEVVYQFPIN